MKHRVPSAAIGGSLEAQDFNHDVYVPISTVWKEIGDRVFTMRAGSREGEIVELSQITFAVHSVDEVPQTARLIEDTLTMTHAGRDKDYALIVPRELLEQARTTTIMFIIFMGSIAAISLVVGGIGIMNIMLATVTERTREIGIRRALGAKRRDIILQFLAETVVLTMIGGVTGVLGGLTCGPLFDSLRYGLEQTMPSLIAAVPPAIRDVRPVVVGWSIPLAFGISVAVGVIFGLYPARRAAALDPIEALRHE
jgi:putative ABC transport system permease protein